MFENMPQMPFPFNMFSMNGNGCNNNSAPQNVQPFPFPFGMPPMPFMFPFPMQSMDTPADTGSTQHMNGFPFPFNMFPVNGCCCYNNSTPQNVHSFSFPFGMPPMPFMFPFPMQGMNTPADTDGTQQIDGFPFPFNMFPMNSGCNNNITPQNAQPFPFDFGNMPLMPFFPFAFPMQSMTADGSGKADSGTSGFSFMGMDIPIEVLQSLLNMDATPEQLEKLQKFIDMIYSMLPKNKR